MQKKNKKIIKYIFRREKRDNEAQNSYRIRKRFGIFFFGQLMISPIQESNVVYSKWRYHLLAENT